MNMLPVRPQDVEIKCRTGEQLLRSIRCPWGAQPSPDLLKRVVGECELMKSARPQCRGLYRKNTRATNTFWSACISRMALCPSDRPRVTAFTTGAA
jgi:hypothetical protein